MNPFLTACGASGPILLSVEAPGGPRETRAFDLPFVLVGRDHRSDLRLNSPEVSERHAYLQVVDGQLLCVDLGSRSGVYQDGKRRRLIQFDRGVTVRIGPYRLRLLGGMGDGPGCEPAEPRASIPLDLTHRSVRQTRCDLQGGFALVGSGADCPIRLVDPSVSPYHCSLVNSAGGLWVVDLLGDGGVRVDGHDVSYARLDPGDALQIGSSVIRPAMPRSGAPVVLPRVVVAPVPAAPEPEPEPAVATPLEPIAMAVAPTPHAPLPSPGLTLAAMESPDHDSGALMPAAQAAEMFERILAPMVGQFEMVQQQMLEEFQQARAVLLDTFASLQDEHSRFVNHELNQLRELSQELQGLRSDLERQSRQLAERAAAMTAAEQAARGPSRLGSASPLVVGSNGDGPVPVPGGPASLRAPADRNGRDRFAPIASLPTSNGNGHNEDVHVDLCDRIARIELEHQSRWQRLAAMLPIKLQPRTMN